MAVDDIGPLRISDRYLHGPGPSSVYPSVLEALGTPLLGHLDPEFLNVMEEVKVFLRYVFETENEFTLPISGTGSAGMEAALFNVIEPGDNVLICTNGYFGTRMAEMVRRCGGVLNEITVPWGTIIDPDDVAAALQETRAKVVGIVHAETSTGVLQPLDDISRIVHEQGALLLVDAVTSLGGVPVEVDKHQIDVCYSGTQKCLSCPPGLAPITFSPAAMDAVRQRKHVVQSWYLDLGLLMSYWGQERVYHHTAPISMNYALHEALYLIAQEGLEACYARHRQNQQALIAGLEAMGLAPLVAPEYRLPSLTTVRIPEGVDEAAVRSHLLHRHKIEIGSGLGELKGQVWRIGLMGYSSRREALERLLGAIEDALCQQAFPLKRGDALSAMSGVYAAAR